MQWDNSGNRFKILGKLVHIQGALSKLGVFQGSVKSSRETVLTASVRIRNWIKEPSGGYLRTPWKKKNPPRTSLRRLWIHFQGFLGRDTPGDQAWHKGGILLWRMRSTFIIAIQSNLWDSRKDEQSWIPAQSCWAEMESELLLTGFQAVHV